MKQMSPDMKLVLIQASSEDPLNSIVKNMKTGQFLPKLTKIK